MPAGAMREGRQSAHVSMAGQEQGSRRATARREERGTEGGARINNGFILVWESLTGIFSVSVRLLRS
jgi:hypothetical protein